jgi:hypothetical protein
MFCLLLKFLKNKYERILSKSERLAEWVLSGLDGVLVGLVAKQGHSATFSFSDNRKTV